MAHYDAVIIGAGPSGLAAAARLSHFGARVLLAEAHTRLGGMNSWHHVLGKEISSGLHAFTNYAVGPTGAFTGPLGKLCKQLRLKPSDLDLRPQGRSGIRFPGRTLAFSNDRELIRSEIEREFPRQIDAFDRFRERVRQTDEGEITNRRSSARAVMREYITDPSLADMLFCPVMFYGNPGGVGGPDRENPRQSDMDWLLFCVVWKCVFESGFAYPVAGMRPLWEKLAARIRENGGDILLGTKVERLVREDEYVLAADFADGRTATADLFFSSAGGEETRRLVRPPPSGREIPVGRTTIAEGIRVLDTTARAIGLDEATLFYSFSERLEFAEPPGLVCTTNGVVCAPGNYEGIGENILKTTLLASYSRWRPYKGSDYQLAKLATGETMTQGLTRLGLNIRPELGRAGRYGFWDDLFTPLTLERFTGHAGGALYGSPVKSRSGRTGYENLVLIGTDQGFHGIVGAMLSGVAMANAHFLAKNH